MSSPTPINKRSTKGGPVVGLSTKSDKTRGASRRRGSARKGPRVYGQPTDSRFEQIRAVVGPGGRVVIPAAYRQALGIQEGDAVFLRLDGDGLRVVSDETEVFEVREMLARYVPAGVSLVDELIEERRREAASDADGDADQ